MVAERVNGCAIGRMDRLSRKNKPEKDDRNEPFRNNEWTDRHNSGTKNRDASHVVIITAAFAFATNYDEPIKE